MYFRFGNFVELGDGGEDVVYVACDENFFPIMFVSS